MIPSVLMVFPVLDPLKHPHSMVLPPPCLTVGAVYTPLPSFPKHKQCLCGQRTLVWTHLTKEHASSMQNLSPDCPWHTPVRLKGVSTVEVELRPTLYIILLLCVHQQFLFSSPN